MKSQRACWPAHQRNQARNRRRRLVASRPKPIRHLGLGFAHADVAMQKPVLQLVQFVVLGLALRAMPLTVRLDSDTEHFLNDLLDETGQDKSSLIRQLIRERWQQRQPRPSITQQLGGHPEAFLDTLPAGSAERQQRRRLLGQHLQKHRPERS